MSTEFGLAFDGEVGFPVGKNELGFDERYILGSATLDDSVKASRKSAAVPYDVLDQLRIQ